MTVLEEKMGVYDEKIKKNFRLYFSRNDACSCGSAINPGIISGNRSPGSAEGCHTTAGIGGSLWIDKDHCEMETGKRGKRIPYLQKDKWK